MTEEINYNIGDVVITPKGKGEIIFKDKSSSKSPMQGKWLYMLEKKSGGWIGPFNHKELELTNE
jgi:hypothetical protein